MLPAPQERPDPQGLLANLEWLEPLDQRDLVDYQALRDRPARKGKWGPQELLEELAQLAQLARRERQD